MNKRILTAALLALLLLNCAACGDTAGTDTKTTDAATAATEAATETEESKLPPSIEQIDMNGFELGIKHHNQTTLSWAKNNLDVEEADGDLFNDAIYERNRTIEELFNCKLNIEPVDWIYAPDVSKEVMAGDSTYDIWYVYDILILDCIEYLMPWENLVNVDLSQPWWNPLATDVFELAGNHYAAAGNYSVSVLSRASGFIFNKDIYNTIGYDKSLYDFVNDNEWTVDKMLEVCIAGYSDINGDGMLDDNDRYGVNGSYKELYNRLFLGSGIQYVKMDDKGLPVFSLPNDEGAINKILHIIDLFADRRAYASLPGSVPETAGLGSLNNGTLLMSVDNLNGLEHNRDLDLNLGFVPCPKYDAAQDRFYAPSFGAEVAVLLKTLPEDRWENVGILMESMNYYSDVHVIPMYKEVLIKTKYARDEESGEMLDIIIDSISFEFGLNAWQNTVANPFVQGAIMKNNANVMSTLEKMTKSVNKTIQKLSEKIAEFE